MAILEAHDIGKRYGRRRWALRHVDLQVPDGSITALVGPNGSGKSTLLKAWVGFERPTVRRDARSARAGRRLARRAVDGRVRRLAPAARLTAQNWTGVVGASMGPWSGVVVTGPRRSTIVAAPKRNTQPPTTNSPLTPLIEATMAPAAGPMIPAA
jgi:energy-coupling factor transporter ATP-binding protein EcfA2